MSFQKLYTDEDVDPLLAQILAQRGYPSTTAKACGNLGVADKDHLLFAAKKGYTLLTHNIRDFCLLAKEFATNEMTHSGIILSPQWKLPLLLKAVLRWLTDLKDSDTDNQVFWLHRYHDR